MEQAGVLKILRLMGAKGFAIFGIKSRDERSFVKNTKGKRLGKTFNAQTLTPFSALLMNFAGEIIMQTRKKRTTILARHGKKACPLKIDVVFFKSYSVLIDLIGKSAL